MKCIGTIAATMLFVFAGPATAFMPAGGLWVIDSENNGQSGRGFQIEVEGEVLVFTYFGYRADGAATFYLAAGPVVGNTFSATLTEYQGGNALGATYTPAHASVSPGPVTISFTSGKHGTMTLPGEVPRAISKFSFGYPDGPDGLLGTWLFSYVTTINVISDTKYLTTKTGQSTAYGNGVVVTASGDFGCEFGTIGSTAGTVTCVDVPQASYADTYFFKFSGDRGTGVGHWITSSGTDSSNYQVHALRISTKTGKETGLNDGTLTSLSAKSAAKMAPSDTVSMLKKQEDVAVVSGPAIEIVKNASGAELWATEIRAIMMAR